MSSAEMDSLREIIGASSINGSVNPLSIANETEILEADANQMQANLQTRGDAAFGKKNYSEALKLYNEALHMDERNPDVLGSRALLYLQLRRFHSAEDDVLKVLSLKPNHPKGHYLLGLTAFHFGQHEKSLSAFLQALELNKDPDHEVMLARNIAALLPKFTEVKDSLMEQILEMDPYRQLCEVGAILNSEKKYKTCLKVLGGARTFQTNQKGITMKVLLMLANCHSAMKRYDTAISLYQECLSTSLSAHDVQYQTKCLVGIASLYISLGEMHQAILHYQQLLDLRQEIQAEDPDAPLPEFWTRELQEALHLNLTLAFKKIGDYQKAIKHAKALAELTKEGSTYMKNESYLNVGILHEVLGEYVEAVDAYKAHLLHCKRNGDKKGTASTYGRLGCVYMELFHSALSLTYHEQHLSLASTLGDAKLISEAHQLHGESFLKLECYEDAVECFMNMFRSCPRKDLHAQTLALCKTAKAYKEMRRFQYSLYYYEQAKVIATDFAYQDIQVMCELNEACILKNSTQMAELDQAKEYLMKLIPKFEEQVKQHAEEDTHCPRDLLCDLSECYNAMQTVLAKLSKKDECLQYAERQRQKFLVDITASGKGDLCTAGSSMNNELAASSEKMKDDVTELNATVIYYSLLEKMMLVWVIQPGLGITRFYNSKWTNVEETVEEHLETLIANLTDHEDVDLRYSGELRALPLENEKLKLLQKRNNELQNAEESCDTESEPSEASSTLITFQSQAASEKPPERQLFDLLLAPVDDLLCNLEDQSPLVIIPDKQLRKCPFAFLKDWDGRTMSDRFKLTVIPSLLAVAKVNKGSARQKAIVDDLELRRSQTRAGGMSKIMDVLDSISRNNKSSKDHAEGLEQIIPRQTTNPRLLNTSPTGRQSAGNRSPDKVMPSRASTLFSLATSKTSVSLKLDSESCSSSSLSMRDNALLGKSPDLRQLSLGKVSTLVTRTATNTDITTSASAVTDFAQISSQETCVVIGSPHLPGRLMLHGEVWKPCKSLKEAENECKYIADIFKSSAIIGKEATKEMFLRQAPRATVLHLATFTCIQKGYLAFSPTTNDPQDEVVPDSSYLVTSPEIALLPLMAKLVVISGGWNTHTVSSEDTFALPSAFLAAGAQCVLMLLWPVPNATLNKFYHHFYVELRKGSQVTEAVKVASRNIMDDQRYNDMWYWAPYCLFGKDVYINIGEIQRAMLDQALDRAETQGPRFCLQPKLAFTPVPSKEDDLDKVQAILKCFIKEGMENDMKEDVLALIYLLDAALKRHHDSRLNKETLEMPDCLTDHRSAKDLLHLLKYKFQISGDFPHRMCVYAPPGWDDNLLSPVLNALEAMTEILRNKSCCRTLLDTMPISQQTISKVVDLLCITKHAREVQLKTSDATVHPLWKNLKMRNFLMCLGYHEVGPLLNCDNIPSSRKLLTACLQFLVSLSVHKSLGLVYNLDVTQLGHETQQKLSSEATITKKLPSINPIMLPGNRIKMITPWLSIAETSNEMKEKMQLARRIQDLQSHFKDDVKKTKTWHRQSVASLANDSLVKIGRPVDKPVKVKLTSRSAGLPRSSLRHEMLSNLSETYKQREEANAILKERLDEVTQNYKDMSKKLYLPYVE